MKILLIGGSGFLSGTMARLAVSDGHTVWAVTRGQRAAVPGVTPIVADRKQREHFKTQISDLKMSWDLVIDCIGFSADDARQDVECFSDCAGHLVFISTDNTISNIDRPWKIDETFSNFSDQAYGKGKRDAEVALLASPLSGMKITILRPCHIYGPGSQLGCLPTHARDTKLIEKIRNGETLTLVGGGRFLQQPVFAPDLYTMSLSCVGNPNVDRQIYFSPGPDIVECRVYYQNIGDVLGKKVTINEVSITDHLNQHPDTWPFCIHRVYDMRKAIGHGLKIPSTPLADGLRVHVESML